jgi:hypothetical protein
LNIDNWLDGHYKTKAKGEQCDYRDRHSLGGILKHQGFRLWMEYWNILNFPGSEIQ